MTTLSCGICCRCFDVRVTPRFVSRNTDKDFVTGHVTLSWFCSNICFATHLLRKRKIEVCVRCQVKKYNVDMIRKAIGDSSNATSNEFKVLDIDCNLINTCTRIFFFLDGIFLLPILLQPFSKSLSK